MSLNKITYVAPRVMPSTYSCENYNSYKYKNNSF